MCCFVVWVHPLLIIECQNKIENDKYYFLIIPFGKFRESEILFSARNSCETLLFYLYRSFVVLSVLAFFPKSQYPKIPIPSQIGREIHKCISFNGSLTDSLLHWSTHVHKLFIIVIIVSSFSVMSIICSALFSLPLLAQFNSITFNTDRAKVCGLYDGCCDKDSMMKEFIV